MRCARCGGLAVTECFYGGETMFEGWSYDGIRCVNCGAIAGHPPAAVALRHPAVGPLRRSCGRLGPLPVGWHRRNTASDRAPSS